MSYFDGYLDALGGDWWQDDPDFATVLRAHGLVDPLAKARVEKFGVFAASSLTDGFFEADRPDTLPRLTPQGCYGESHPVGVEVHPATRRVLAASLRAGLATEPDRVVRYAMAYLGAQAGEGGVLCPIACTDGLVRAVDELDCGGEAKAAAAHIRLQAPHAPVHGAQFVTEIQGGSDAATNAVVAKARGDGSYALFGNKFFCSNLWAQYWVVTARPEGAPDGARGVGLFLVPRELPVGRANSFRVLRLKDKLGTRALPTGEIDLSGAVGWPLGDLQAGLANMVRIVLTTSRFWTGLAGVAAIRGAERVATAYARFRPAFGGSIARFPLIADTLETLGRERRHLTAAAWEVLAAWEAVAAREARGGAVNPEVALRSRVLVMLWKTVATARATRRVHDAIMVLGGNGIEERFSPLPRLLRDCVILETWEGPHGLLLARSSMELRRAGADDAPERAVRLLLGEGADGDDVIALGAMLGQALRSADERASMRAFRTFADDLFDRFGAAAWRRAEAVCRAT